MTRPEGKRVSTATARSPESAASYPPDRPETRRPTGFEAFEFPSGTSARSSTGGASARAAAEYPVRRVRVGPVASAGTSLRSAE